MTRHDPYTPRVLVVDDTPDNLFLMKELLQDRYEVMTAASGPECLKIVMSRRPPDLFLLDIMMPGMDGYEVLRRIRQHPSAAHIPVAFLSALDAPDEQRLGLDLGALDYLTKPVDPSEVFLRVNAHMEQIVQSRRVEALSERLSRHLTPQAWQRLFNGTGLDTVHFEQRELTVLFAESAELAGCNDRERDSFMAEVEWLATRHRGRLDRYGWGGTLVYFEDPATCVRMAMDLQRSAAELHLRVGIHTGECETATFRSEGETHHTLIGAQSGQAAQVAGSAARGSIAISSGTYAQVQDELRDDMSEFVLMEEIYEGGAGIAQLTPAPFRGGQAASTFAGLGLS